MTFLPRAAAQRFGLTLQAVDYGGEAQQDTAGATGTATVEYEAVEAGQWWRVERIVARMPSAPTKLVGVYVTSGGTISDIYLRDSTPLPSGYDAIAEYPNPITVRSGEQLVVQATGGNPGDVLTVHAQWAVVVPASGTG